MLRTLFVTPFALALGLLLANADATASSGQAACPSECDSCDAGTCHIVCGPGSSCAQETVTCPAGMDCDVSCTGEAACLSATIVGPIGHELDVECSGAASCGEVVFDSGRDLELVCKGDDACNSATLYCGSGTCDWACATAGSCDGVEVE